MTENDEGDNWDFTRSGTRARGVRIIHDWSSEESIVATIASAVSEVSGEPPAEPLHHRIDTDALEAIFRPISEGRRRDEGCVTFSIGEFEVTVDANGLILIDEQ